MEQCLLQSCVCVCLTLLKAPLPLNALVGSVKALERQREPRQPVAPLGFAPPLSVFCTLISRKEADGQQNERLKEKV